MFFLSVLCSPFLLFLPYVDFGVVFKYLFYFFFFFFTALGLSYRIREHLSLVPCVRHHLLTPSYKDVSFKFLLNVLYFYVIMLVFLSIWD